MKMEDILNEKTLVLIKPDAIQRGLIGEIIARFEKLNLRITDIKLITPDEEFAKKHYPVTDEWYENVGQRTVADCEKYGFNAKELMGTDSPVEIGKLIHKWNVEFFTGAKIIALVIEGVHAVEAARKICGPTLPILAPPGTIRGDFSTVSAIAENSFKRAIYNLIHASGSVEEAKREIKLWF